jgi:hypothetical protein
LLQRRYDALASQSDAQTQRHLDYEEQIHGYASVSVFSAREAFASSFVLT